MKYTVGRKTNVQCLHDGKGRFALADKNPGCYRFAWQSRFPLWYNRTVGHMEAPRPGNEIILYMKSH